MWSITGKIINVKDLIPAGKFNINEIQWANNFHRLPEDRDKMVPRTPEIKRQLWWWRIFLPTCAWRLPILDPDRTLPAWAKDAYTDAAGGSIIAKGVGVLL